MTDRLAPCNKYQCNVSWQVAFIRYFGCLNHPQNGQDISLSSVYAVIFTFAVECC